MKDQKVLHRKLGYPKMHISMMQHMYYSQISAYMPSNSGVSHISNVINWMV